VPKNSAIEINGNQIFYAPQSSSHTADTITKETLPLAIHEAVKTHNQALLLASLPHGATTILHAIAQEFAGKRPLTHVENLLCSYEEERKEKSGLLVVKARIKIGVGPFSKGFALEYNYKNPRSGYDHVRLSYFRTTLPAPFDEEVRELVEFPAVSLTGITNDHLTRLGQENPRIHVTGTSFTSDSFSAIFKKVNE
jgi:hypothetical protein